MSKGDKQDVFSIRVSECEGCRKGSSDPDGYWDEKYMQNLIFETRMVSQKIDFKTLMPFVVDQPLGSRVLGSYFAHSKVINKVQLKKNHYNIGNSIFKFSGSINNQLWDYLEDR